MTGARAGACRSGVKYARHARGGRTDPSSLSRYIDRKPPLREPQTVLTEIAAASAPDAYLRDLHPKHAQFQRLRQVLLKQGTASSEDADERPVALPDGPQLKPGMRHPHVALLRRRLAVAAVGGEPDAYDEELAAAVRAFQIEHGLKPSGLLTPRTRSALNGPPRPRRDADAQLIVLNMERWRWMPEDLGELHVLDNIPEFTMRVLKNGETVHQEKMVVGKLETQTPIFSADMKEVIFHPDWGVPDSIKVNELLPYLRRGSAGFFGFGGGADTRVLERHNLRVSYNGRPVDASMVDWNSVDIRRFTFIQPAGAGNVLGVLKFRFPNRHDVYMHDTPQRELFSQSRRTFSHGCMRVQNPRRLAEVLLGEDQGMSAAHVGNLLARGQQTDVQLRRKIPVHVAYFTAVVDERGRLETFPDVYGHDRRLAAALEGRPLPLIEPREELSEAIAPPREARRSGRTRTRDTGDPLSNIVSGILAN
jgi:murein L,D-transpeptidase YcbB/YkuD